MSTGGVKIVMKEKMLAFAKLTGGFALARRMLPKHLRILAYHGLWTTPGFEFGNRLFINPDQFERRMRWLTKSRHPVLDLDHAIEALATGTLPDNSVVITIDDGWKSSYTHMLPILEQLRLPATIYVTTWYADKQFPVLNVALNYVLQRSTVPGFTWCSPTAPELKVELGATEHRELIALKLDRMLQELPRVDDRLREFREICRLAEVPTEPWWSEGQFHLMNREEIRCAGLRGMDIQLHTHRHRNIDYDIKSLPNEILKNRSVLSQACGSDKFFHFCYPNGRYDAAASEVLLAAGIRSAVLTEQGLNPPGANPYALRRFLDGRSVTQTEFEAYMCGALDLYAATAKKSHGPPVRDTGEILAGGGGNAFLSVCRTSSENS
jgi:peptidoglycan/xylan/chitin deacetylase (PgdA/CDA1 family)